MTTIAERIKKVRNKYRATQSQFAALGKVSMRAQQTYESGKRVPDSNYLINLAKFNIDIHYILTGNVLENSLNSEENQLVEEYRFADPSKKAAMMAVAKSSTEDDDDNDNPPPYSDGKQDQETYSPIDKEESKYKLEMSSLVFKAILIVFAVVMIGELIEQAEFLQFNTSLITTLVLGYLVVNAGMTFHKQNLTR